MAEVILAYVPVLHAGYVKFFRQHPRAETLYLVGEGFTYEVEALAKDIRALSSLDMGNAITALGIFKQVKIVQKMELEELAKDANFSWILPDEELMHSLAETYLKGRVINFDTTFLRWDRQNILAQKEVTSAKTILPESFNQIFLDTANQLKEKSADWWRQVGGVLVKNGEMLFTAWNQHAPSPLEPYFNGDPRASFHKGEFIELSTAIHAESALIAEAAKKGVSLADADLYVTTFPCPVCAKLIAAAGIKSIYYSEGYAMLDGESILQASGVQIFKVESAPRS